MKNQGLINLMLQEFHLTPTELPLTYNQPASSPNRILCRAFIIHAQGHRKPWSYYYFDEWYNYYTRWLSLGGDTTLVRLTTPLWDKWLAKVVPNPLPVPPPPSAVFFLLAPNATKYPGKFLLFAIKRFLRRRY